jgi:tRNA A-37 threonylcarbamoyl transferase component Bud32
MDQSQIFFNRLFVFSEETDDNAAHDPLIREVFQIYNPKLTVVNQKLLYSTLDFDCYRVASEDRVFNLKLSLDPDNEILIRESLNLKKITREIGPKVLYDGKINIGESVRVLISTQEISDNILDIGRGFLIENLKKFISSYKILQEKKAPKWKLSDNLDIAFKTTQIKDNFFEDALISLREHVNVDIILRLFSEIKREISTLYDTSIIDKDKFCHGDLRICNIVTRNNRFKMINWGKAYQGNPFLDISCLINSLGVRGELRSRMIAQICEDLNITYSQVEYNLCDKITSLLTLQQLIVDYLYEIYMFGGGNHIKICRIANDFSQNFSNFIQFPFFSENKNFLLKLLTEPVVGLRAEN